MRTRGVHVLVLVLSIVTACSGDDEDDHKVSPIPDAGLDATGGTSTGGVSGTGTGGMPDAATGGIAGVAGVSGIAGAAGAPSDAAPEAEVDAPEDVSIDAELDADDAADASVDVQNDVPDDVAPEAAIDASLATWGFAFGNPVQQDTPGPVAFDTSGNAFVTATVVGNVTIGTTGYAALGSNDTMLIKLDPSGVPLWVHRGGGIGDDRAHGVAVDGSGNVYMTGMFTDSASFGGATLVSAGSWDIFVAKYSPSGTHLWSKRFGDVDQDEANALGVDSAGNVYVAGDFWGSVSFGGPTLTPDVIDSFALKLDPSGNHVWSIGLGGTGADSARGLAVTPNGESYVFGTFEGTADFGDGPHVTSSGDKDVFLVKLSASGAKQWSHVWGSNNVSEAPMAVATDPSGNVALAGFFQGQMAFGPTPLTSGSGNDCFIAKLDSTGAHLFSHVMGGPGLQRCTSIATTVGGDVVLAADYDGDMTVVDTVHTAKPGGSFLVAKLGPTGLRKWSVDYTEGQPWYAAMHSSGSSLVTGRFSNSLNMGAISLVGGAFDMFLVQLPP